MQDVHISLVSRVCRSGQDPEPPKSGYWRENIYQQSFLWSVLREGQKLQVLAELGAEGSVDNFVNLETQHPHMPVLHQKNVNVDKILAKVQATLPSHFICIFSFLHSRHCKNFWAVLLFCPSSGYTYSLTRILGNSTIV